MLGLREALELHTASAAAVHSRRSRAEAEPWAIQAAPGKASLPEAKPSIRSSAQELMG